MVETMIGNGIPQHTIAAIVGICPKTLRRHYQLELRRGGIRANARVAENLFRIACGTGREAVTAAIYWTKTRMAWSTEKG